MRDDKTPERKAVSRGSGPNAKSGLSQFLSLLGRFFTSSQDVLGIDIGYSYMKILQLQKTAKGYVIAHCITRAIPQNVKEDPAGRRKFIQGAVKQFISDSKIKTNLARLAISGKGVFIFSITAPAAISKKDLRGLVGIELKKRLPFQLEISNMSYDFFTTGQQQDEKGVSLQLTCVAVDRLTIDEQIGLLKDMDISPVAINAVSDALGNLLPYCLNAPGDRTVTLLDIGANTSLLNFYKGKNLVFSREIPVGGEHITRAMAKPIPASSGTVELGVEDAEKIKRNVGIPLEDESRQDFLTDYGVFQGEQISTALRPTLERLILEITRTVSYYTKTFKAEDTEALYITGGSSRLRNIDKFLLYNLERLTKVEHLPVLSAVKGWSETGVFRQELVMEQAAPHLAVAFGLCLGSGGRVNLLPVKEKVEQKTVFLMLLFKVFFPVILVLVLSWYVISIVNNHKYRNLIRKTNSDISRLEPTASKVKEYLNIKTKFEERKESLEKAEGKQPLWWGIFKELSNITPPGVVLTQITAVAGTEPKQLRLAGRIVSRYTVVDVELSQYLIALEESPYFRDVVLVSSEKDLYSPMPAAKFEITCTLVY